jgi:hypothetical protein
LRHLVIDKDDGSDEGDRRDEEDNHRQVVFLDARTLLCARQRRLSECLPRSTPAGIRCGRAGASPQRVLYPRCQHNRGSGPYLRTYTDGDWTDNLRNLSILIIEQIFVGGALVVTKTWLAGVSKQRCCFLVTDGLRREGRRDPPRRKGRARD